MPTAGTSSAGGFRNECVERLCGTAVAHHLRHNSRHQTGDETSQRHLPQNSLYRLACAPPPIANLEQCAAHSTCRTAIRANSINVGVDSGCMAVMS